MKKLSAKQLAEFKSRVNSVSETDIAWFSDWLCADGCISIADSRGRPSLKFTICDRDPLLRFSALFGNAVSGPQKPSGLGKKERYHWGISGCKAVAILERCLPWLSDRYLHKAETSIKTFVVRGHGGHKLNPPQIQQIKAALATPYHGLGTRLAHEFGVSKGMISAIKKGRVWNN